MHRRILPGVIAVAMSLSLLVMGTAAAAESTSTPSSPARLEPRSAAGIASGIYNFGKGLYDKYQTCKANEAVGAPCSNTDSDNIRLALQKLNEIQAAMEANQDELVANLKALHVKIDSAALGRYIAELRGVASNATDAVGAFEAMMDCMQAKSEGKAECKAYHAGLDATPSPVDAAIEASRMSFLNYAGNLPQDLPKTVEIYTGNTSGADVHSLSFAMWQLAKSRQEADARVSNTKIMLGTTSPIVTPQMAAEVNSGLDYYGTLYSMYAAVLYAQAKMRASEAAPGSADATTWGHRANLLSAQIDRNIESTNVRSIGGTDAVYRLTALNDGEIMMATKSGVGVIIFSGDSATAGDRPMTYADVEILGQGLKNYGVYSSLQANRPSAFPADGWYEVYAPVQRYTVTPTRALHGFGSARYDVNQIALAYKYKDEPISDIMTRMRLLDKKPSWDSKYQSSCYGCNYWSWSFKKSLEQNVPWPATYDWLVMEYRGEGSYSHIGSPDYAGPGGYILETKLPANRVATPQNGNIMVKWPTGFTPTMPSKY